MINHEHPIMRIGHFIAGFVAVAVAGCVAMKADNKPPIAQVDISGTTAPMGVSTAKSGDKTIITATIPFMGAPVPVTLDGTKSTDPDGAITTYKWLRTDFPAASRFAGDAGPPPDSGLPMFTGDPPSGPTASTIMVTLSAPGKYRYSLWVQDDYGAYSAPATVVVQIGVPPPKFVPMPDMMCTDKYMSPKKGCAECVCTPTAMGGCLDAANTCLNNTDPMFSTLCSAALACVSGKTCTGTACFTKANPCMAELTAAATYMGGTFDACSMPMMGATNPCAASTALLACTTAATSACAATCK